MSAFEQASAALDTLARRGGLTANTVVQGAFALLLSHYRGCAEVLFGVTVAGRPSALPSAAKEVEVIGVKKGSLTHHCSNFGAFWDPRPSRCEKLAGSEERYRIRQRNYRVVYAVDDLERVVEVVKVGHRREALSQSHLVSR